MSDAVIVFSTCANREEATKIAAELVNGRLAACVQILPAVQSFYRWKGNVEDAEETLILVKTTQDCFSALQRRIAELHSYETPEILAVPVSGGAEKYLSWLNESVSKPARLTSSGLS